jgi:folate-binding Fe-S cluster repair protein YgfZ
MSTRDRVRVAGPDAETFLQGQLSQDVTAVGVGESKLSFLLQPQGKVDALLTVHRVAEDEFVLSTDEGWGEAVVTRLSRFKLRTKADIELVDPVDDGDDEAPRLAAGWPKMGAEIDERTIPAELGQAIIDQAVEVDGKNVGALTSVAGTSALGFVGRSVEPPASAEVRWDGGVTTAAIEPS